MSNQSVDNKQYSRDLVIDISLKTLQIVNKELITKNEKGINTEIMNLAETQYISDIINQVDSKNDKSNKCIAITKGKKQCSKKKFGNSQYCKHHLEKTNISSTNDKDNDNDNQHFQTEHNNIKKPITKKLVNAVEKSSSDLVKISEPANTIMNTSEPDKIKRGRKARKVFDPKKNDKNYLTLWEDIVEGERVLVDINNNVYTYNLEHPRYIGKKDITIPLNITPLHI
jgi:hypothetical protein